MRFSQYNKKSTLRNITLFVIIALESIAAHPSQAQQFGSRQQRSDYERFELLRPTNRDSAYHYAERIVNDIDSLATNSELAIVYDFMAEYAETTLHSYGKSLEYRLQSARIYEALGNKPCLTRTNALLGRIYLRNGDYHNAFSYSTNALKEAKRTGDTTSMREAYLALEQVTYFYHNDIV